MDNLTVLSETKTNITPDTFIGENVPLWASYIEQFYICLTMLIGAPGNALILYVQFKNKETSSTDILIAAMAVYEFICSSILAVIRLLVSSRLWVKIASNYLCRLHFGLGYITTFASSYLLAAIAVDRYIKTCWPLSNRFKVKTSKIVCVFVFFAGCLASGFVWVSVIVNERFECVVDLEYLYLQLPWDMVLISSTAVVFLIFIFTYVNIAISLRKRVRRKAKIRPVKVLANPQNKIRSGTSKNEHLAQTTKLPIVDLESADKDQVHRAGCCGGNDEIKDCKPSSSSGYSSQLEERNKPQKRPHVVRSHAESVEKTANRVTLIMFLLALIYALTYTTVNVCVATKGAMGPVMEKFCKSLLVINCISNPVLLFCMSSRYRAVVKTLVFRRRT